MTALRTRALGAPPWLIALVPAMLWLAFAPATPDLAAAQYRVDLYRHLGLGVWDNFWYSGHHLPAYSVLYPMLAAHVGLRALGVICAVLSAVLFDQLASRHFGERARWGVRLFAFGTVAGLGIGQLTFSLGLCVGLAALLAWQRARPTAAVVLAAATGLASPVAAAFLALAACAVIAGRRAARDRTNAIAVLVAGAALATVIALALAFPEGGRQPFALQSLLPLLGSTVVLGLAFGSAEPVLRAGAVIYALAALASYVLSTPMGSNANRLGAAFALALLACAPLRRRALLVAACVALFAWQWNGPVRDIRLGSQDDSVHASYFAPLLGYLTREATAPGLTTPPGRLEIPFTRLHWETRYVARDFPLARGWERQLDTKYDGLFYHHGSRLGAGEYHAWLRANAVRWVALPDVRLDFAGKAEGALIRSGLPYLRRVWTSRHWQLFEVRDPLPLAGPAVRLTSFDHEGLTGTVSRAGWIALRVRYTPYFKVGGAVTCARDAPGGWTRLLAARPGEFSVRATFAISRLLRHESICRL